MEVTARVWEETQTPTQDPRVLSYTHLNSAENRHTEAEKTHIPTARRTQRQTQAGPGPSGHPQNRSETWS